MEPKGFIEEVKMVMQRYRFTLAPGRYLFAPELVHGKMTGKIIEERADCPSPAQLSVTFGFCPLGFAPESLKGAPPSWLSGYPLLPGLEKLAEAPTVFLELLKQHVEERMLAMEQAGLTLPAAQPPVARAANSAEDCH